MKVIKRPVIVFLIITMLFLTGCWNYREIDSLTIVAGIAIDSGELGSKYHLTFQCVSLSQGKNEGTKPELIETDGDTIFDAVRNSINQSKTKLYFGDCKIVIISSNLAEEGLTPIIDFFNRDNEPRITNELVISTESKASDILQQEAGSQEITAYSINKIIENSIKYLGKSPDVAIYQANSLLTGKGISLILPSVAMLEYDSKKTPKITGTSVFKEDKLIGFLNDKESRYLLTIKDKLKGGIITTNVNSQEDNVSLEIVKNQTKCIPTISDDVPKIKLEIITEVVFAEENSFQNNLSDLGSEEVEKCAENTIQNGVLSIIEKVQQEYNSDIFGFGSCIYKTFPNYWEEHGDQWDQIFPTINVEVSVRVKISNTETANPRKDE